MAHRNAVDVREADAEEAAERGDRPLTVRCHSSVTASVTPVDLLLISFLAMNERPQNTIIICSKDLPKFVQQRKLRGFVDR